MTNFDKAETELSGANTTSPARPLSPAQRSSTFQLADRLTDRSATIGIIGQGYVGLPLALLFHEAGFPVVGFDVDPKKVEILSKGESFITHIGPERVAQAVLHGGYTPTTDFARLDECDVIAICVPTPLGIHREPDNSYIHKTGRQIAQHMRAGQLIVLESTTYPGTTDEELKPILETSGLECGKDFYLAFSPEREDPGRRDFDTKSTAKIVGGVDDQSTKLAVLLYETCVATVVSVSSSRVAESSKLLENVFRSVNIALVNELKTVFDRMGIDIWEVIDAAKTKPFGFMPFYPGPGLGGHCIPLDPFYLSWKAAEYGQWARFVELAGEINTSMPRWVVEKTAEGLNDDRKPVKGSRILVLGLAYKADIDDDRESPSYEIIELLQASGALVDYCDPFFPVTPKTRKRDLGMRSVPRDNSIWKSYDAVVIVTAHALFREAALFDGIPLVIDTRNLLGGLGGDVGPKRVVKA